MKFDASNCKKSPWLHKFISIKLHPDALYERCARCGKKNVVKLIKGNPHMIQFARYHKREFLIPQHRLFFKEYAKAR